MIADFQIWWLALRVSTSCSVTGVCLCLHVTFNVRNMTVQCIEPTPCLVMGGGGGAWLVLPVSFRPEQSHVLQHHRDIRVFIKRLRSGIVTLLLLCMFRTASQARVAAPVNSYSLTLFSILAFINKPAANCRLALSISPLCCRFWVALVGCTFRSSIFLTLTLLSVTYHYLPNSCDHHPFCTTVKKSFHIPAFISHFHMILVGVENAQSSCLLDPHSYTLSLLFTCQCSVILCGHHLRRFLWEYELNKGSPAQMVMILNTINVILYGLWVEIFLILCECVIFFFCFCLCAGVFKPVCTWDFLSLISCMCVFVRRKITWSLYILTQQTVGQKFYFSMHFV